VLEPIFLRAVAGSDHRGRCPGRLAWGILPQFQIEAVMLRLLRSPVSLFPFALAFAAVRAASTPSGELMQGQLEASIEPLRQQLVNHSIYSSIREVQDVRTFMEAHVFAVWDFMSLVKQLQQMLTSTSVPWRPAGHPKAARLINEIVFGEESDLNSRGEARSHFEMYLEAMGKLGASAAAVEQFLHSLPDLGAMQDYISNASYLPAHVADFLSFTFEVIQTKKPHIVAAVFTFGREDLIPAMFIEMVKGIQLSQQQAQSNASISHHVLSDLVWYFERHIEVDGEEHGPLTLEMVRSLCGDDRQKWEEATNYAATGLQMRLRLWDGIVADIGQSSRAADELGRPATEPESCSSCPSLQVT